MSVVVRAAAIMGVLADSNRGLSLAEIAQRTGLARSSVHRILKDLEEQHYVMPVSRQGGYRLGPGLLKLAASSHAQLVAEMRPVMVALAREVQENVDLAVLSGNDVVVVEQVKSSQRLQAVTEVGGTFAAHASSLGKVLLAQLPVAQVEQALQGPLTRFTVNTVTDRKALLAQLDQVRASGFGYDHEEHDIGISSVATLVHNSVGVTQALSVVAPSHRFGERSPAFIDALRLVRRARQRAAAV